MHVLRNSWRGSHQAEKVVGEIHWLNRTQPDAPDGGFVQQTAQQIGQPHLTACFSSPAAQIDARQHDFLVMRGDRAHLGDHLVRAHVPAFATDERNHAEGTAIMAAVLNLQIRARTVSGRVEKRRIQNRSRQDISRFEDVSNHNLPVIRRRARH